MSNPRIIVSLDFAERRAALDLARTLNPDRCRVKVGKELFTRYGPAVVDDLVELGYDVFLDLKFHDIPNTVASACRAAAALNVWMLNVHAAGGRAMLESAREALEQTSVRPLLIGVTVLTSLGDRDLRETGVESGTAEQVMRLAGLAHETGLDGVVCSAQEATELRRCYGDDFCLVTPGIRPPGSSADDQSRVVTPARALAAGSDYLVIGRPVTRADDPPAALAAIEAGMDEPTRTTRVNP